MNWPEEFHRGEPDEEVIRKMCGFAYLALCNRRRGSGFPDCAHAISSRVAWPQKAAMTSERRSRPEPLQAAKSP
jgi:hypothetical protein